MVWGYDDKKSFFERLFREDSLSHAYLFYGEEEIGKFTFAKELANFIETGDWISSRPLLDTLILDVGSFLENRSTIGVDEVLKAESFLYQRPFYSSKKILIVNDAYRLTKEAQSALLKIVEEPPEKALIIFVSQEKEDLFEALLSRVEKIYFPTISQEKIVEFLGKNYELDLDKAQKIASLSFGRLGRAIKMLEEGKKSGDGDVEDIEERIEKLILNLYFKGLQKNRLFLRYLLSKEVVIKKYKRYNLNIKLQEKEISYFLNKNGYGKI